MALSVSDAVKKINYMYEEINNIKLNASSAKAELNSAWQSDSSSQLASCLDEIDVQLANVKTNVYNFKVHLTTYAQNIGKADESSSITSN